MAPRESPVRSATVNRCPRCSASLTTPIACFACRTPLSPPSGTDFFDWLGAPRRFDLDETALREAFRAIACCIHPDRFAKGSPEALELATRLSADLNHAYQVLSDPVARAEFLLESSGGPRAAELRDVSGDLLADVMMLREEMADARTTGELDAIERHRAAIAARRESAMGTIEKLARRLPDGDDAQKQDLRRVLNSMKYFDNLLRDFAAEPLQRGAHD